METTTLPVVKYATIGGGHNGGRTFMVYGDKAVIRKGRHLTAVSADGNESEVTVAAVQFTWDGISYAKYDKVKKSARKAA